MRNINPLKTQLNPICHLLALLGAHHILHVSRIRVNKHWNALEQELIRERRIRCSARWLVNRRITYIASAVSKFPLHLQPCNLDQHDVGQPNEHLILTDTLRENEKKHQVEVGVRNVCCSEGFQAGPSRPSAKSIKTHFSRNCSQRVGLHRAINALHLDNFDNFDNSPSWL